MGDMDMGEHQHEHHGPVEFPVYISFMLVVHLLSVAVAYGVIYPYSFACKQAGMKQRHLIFQIVGAVLGVVGFLAGHMTGIDHYNSWYCDIGIVFAWAVTAGSLLLLVYVPKGILSHLKNAINVAHTSCSTIQPLICWVTTGLSVISLLQYCGSEGSHTGQCLAHGIMGTAFIVYGVILLVMMYCGERFLAKCNRSQEYFDSMVIMIWGIINTFTEHRWGEDWGHGDVQHTSMGVVWWALGALGVYMSWDRVNNKPQRTHVPALIILATAYAMMTHTQNTMVSTNIHFMFGVMLAFAALARIIEISFVLKDQNPQGTDPTTWQFLTPFFMVESGMLFMSATEEAMYFLNDQGIMAAPYVLVISSFAGLVALMAIFVVQSYMGMKRALQSSSSSSNKHHEDGIEMPFLQRDQENINEHDFELSD